MPIHTIDAKTLKKWIDNGEAVVVDVREPAEHAAQKITGASSIPLAKIEKSCLPESNGKKVVLHCQAGKRSTAACEKLIAEDPNIEIYNLGGGISAWGAAGHMVASSGKFFLPLDRQVQLAIGILLISGSVLGYFFSPAWFLLTGLIGAGLSFAGITGFCGLALVMTKMPWNKNTANMSCCVTK